ncbi:sugar kinase [Puia sp.]|uniref:sugar kinase n=1 Tax=Puia sp. TaxID=2045100 RepID=UPI002F411912
MKNKIELVAFGELMLRLHARQDRRFAQTDGYDAYYAGAEANACVLLSRLGVGVDYVTILPDNDIARTGVRQLQGQGVATDHIVYRGEKLGVYFTEQGNGIRPTRVIYDRDGSSYARTGPGVVNWDVCLDGASWFHWSGIAAAVSQSAADATAEALTIARKKGLRISADFNYRTTLWKYGKHPREVMPGLLQHSSVAVADLDSAAVYFGIETDPAASFEDRFGVCSAALREKIPGLEVLGMSFRTPHGIQHGYFGALLYKGECYFSTRHELPFITDQIGSGDAFTAGMLYGLMRGLSPQLIIEHAAACGALKQSIEGDWALITPTEVEQFILHGSTGRIIR